MKNIYEDEFWLNQDFMRPGGIDFTKELLEKSGLKSGKILDIGCGKGKAIEFLLNNNFEPFGLDSSKKFITENKIKYPKAQFVQFELKDNIPFENDFFDAVFCECFFSSFVYDKTILLKEINGVLKQRGCLLINELYSKNSLDTKMISSIEYWNKILKEANFKMTFFKDKTLEMKNYILQKIWNSNSFLIESCVPKGFNLNNLGYFSCILKK